MIKYSDNFLHEARVIFQSHAYLKHDFQRSLEEIESLSDMGVSLGYGMYKKEISHAASPSIKRDYSAVVVYMMMEEEMVLISLFLKTPYDILNDNELKEVLQSSMS